jgi:hypothetical protein
MMKKERRKKGIEEKLLPKKTKSERGIVVVVKQIPNFGIWLITNPLHISERFLESDSNPNPQKRFAPPKKVHYTLIQKGPKTYALNL